MYMKSLSQLETGYIAGIIDGEGSIGVGRHRKKMAHEQLYNYSTFVTVCNTNIDLLNWLVRKTNVGTYYPNINVKKGWKTNYVWRVKANEQLSFLATILPHLVLKREQAELVIEYLNRCKGAYDKIPTLETYVLRAVIYDRLQEINKRGS